MDLPCRSRARLGLPENTNVIDWSSARAEPYTNTGYTKVGGNEFAPGAMQSASCACCAFKGFMPIRSLYLSLFPLLWKSAQRQLLRELLLDKEEKAIVSGIGSLVWIFFLYWIAYIVRTENFLEFTAFDWFRNEECSDEIPTLFIICIFNIIWNIDIHRKIIEIINNLRKRIVWICSSLWLLIT